MVGLGDGRWRRDTHCVKTLTGRTVLAIHFANQIETLTDILLARLEAQQHKLSVFDSIRVITPTSAMQRHIARAMAHQQGVCANVEFDYLAQWLWRQLGERIPERQSQAPYDPGQMVWRVFSILGDTQWLSPESEHPRLGAYLAAADTLMRYELAVQITQLFEQYQAYRSDWLAAWSVNTAVPFKNAAASADAEWQAELWRRLKTQAGSALDDPLPALRAAMVHTNTDTDSNKHAAPAVHIFAPPTLAPLHLALLEILSNQVPVVIYALNPCEEYWFDAVDRRRLAYLARAQAAGAPDGAQGYFEEGNRLLVAWGKQTQASLGLLMAHSGDAVIDDARFTPYAAPGVLGALQNAILGMHEIEAGTLSDLLTAADHHPNAGAVTRSLEVHVCHSLSREVEVLQGRLLQLFAQNDLPGGPLAPHDIVVVTPDIDAAAPLVEALFGTAPAHLYIPYTITGRARIDINAPARALHDLLGLVDSRCTVSALFGLLQQGPVARRFGLDEVGLDSIREWLIRSGAHWGLDAEHRDALGLGGGARFSVADALARLFAAYAMPGSVTTPFCGLLPAGDIEGMAAYALGALADFVTQLSELQRRCATAHIASDWGDVLCTALSQFVSPSPQELEDMRDVQATLERLSDQLQRATEDQQLQTPLPLALVRKVLIDMLDDPARGGVPTGMVTFTSMSSLRNIPYRVVCALGLNDGAFPAYSPPLEFDLMAQQPRAGDRQRRLDERNVFLDCVLAARAVLHLSYVGRSVRDNSVLPPSVVLSELLDYLVPALAPSPDAAGFAKALAYLRIEQPLQPFSEAAFSAQSDARVRSFHTEYAAALQRRGGPDARPSAVELDVDDEGDNAVPGGSELTHQQPFFMPPLPPATGHWTHVSLDALRRFYANPCRYLLAQRLGLALPRSSPELEDSEPLLPDNATRRALAQRLLPQLLQGRNSALRALAEAGTELPAGAFASAFLDRELPALTHFAETVQSHQSHTSLPFGIEGGGHQVTWNWQEGHTPWQFHATLTDVPNTGLFHWRYDRLKIRDLFDVWLQHLVLCCATPHGVRPKSMLLTRDGLLQFRQVQTARTELETLLHNYAQGLELPLYFFPRSAWAYMEKGGSRTAALGQWQVTPQQRFGESADPAFALALRGLPDPFASSVGYTQFVGQAQSILAPLIAHLEPL